MKLSRRSLLGTGLAAGAAFLFSGDTARAQGAQRLFPHLDSARRVGRQYLERNPGEASREALLAALDLPPDIGWDDLADLLPSLLERDFRAGNTLYVDNWMLARCEARLCALTVVTSS
ncbi:hypothetical protein [Telmatospirillum sp. J64-1]|uniref:hypothetical protein n=1 Tax=Telmatospirillum sp. J64-1 TaxID=2502183 RepID=UPI00115D8BFC|nr:hypothetical protein [Telmatospirillum sp. J64-1]